ncbi:autophagy-related protein 16 [Usnea florida]
MPSWRDDYLSALQERDKKEKANQAILSSYAKLANRTATLQAAPSAELTGLQEEPRSSPSFKERKTGREKAAPGSPTTGDAIIKVRQDLSEAQRSRGVMETRLQSAVEELQKLKIQCSLDSKLIGELSKEKATLSTGMRDRDEELRGKAKLLEDIHDETVSLTLQLNMAEETSQKLKRENKELVDRWMARMGQEADAMNDESKFS